MNRHLKLKRFEYLIALVGYFLVSLFILSQVLFAYSGTVGFFHDWPIGPYPDMNRRYADGGLYVWDSQQGNILYPTDWIYRLSLIPFSFLDGEVLTKGLLLLAMTLSGFGAFCLGKQLKLSPFASFAAGILYIFSPIIFTRIVAGYIYYLIAYFLSPFIVTLFLKGRREKEDDNKEQKQQKQKEKKENEKKEPKRNKSNFKYFIIAGILTSFAAIQLQFLVMIFLILLVFSIIDFGRIKKSAVGLIVVFSIAALINLPPVVLSEVPYSKVANSYFNPLQVLLSYHEIRNAASLTKSFRLLGYESHPYSYEKIGTSEDPLFKSDINKTGDKTNLVANPDFVFNNSTSNNHNPINNNAASQSRLPTYWSDPLRNCNITFKCTVINSKEITAEGQKNNNGTNSLQVSTNTTNKNRWSSIYGNQLNVKPGEPYAIITHMKLNEFVTGSHIVIEGYDITSKKWNQFKPQCPSGTNGPLEWHEYICEITIPKNTVKIRPVLNAGWSSQPGKQAVTLFDDIEIIKLNDTSLIIPSWVFNLDFLLPIVGFSALIFRQDKYTISLAVISVIGIFLLKGPNPPLSGIFNFIFIHGFYIFRELWHIAFLYGFGISFLIAFFLERVVGAVVTTTKPSVLSKLEHHSSSYDKQRRWWEYRNNTSNIFYQLAYSVLSFFYHAYSKLNIYHKVILSSLLVSLIVISNGYPLLIGDFGGYIQTYSFPKDYHTIYQNLLTNNTYNTLILPLFAPIKYSSSKLPGLDPLITYSPSNIFYQFVYDDPSYPLSAFTTWLHTVMQQNKTNDLGKLLSGFGIKYIFLRKDFVSNYPDYVNLGSYGPFRDKWFSSLEPFLDAQKDLTVISNKSNYKIYKNTNDAQKISFVPQIIGNGLSDYRTLLYISNFTSLANIAIYPSDYNDNNNSNSNYTNSNNLKVNNKSVYGFTELGKYVTSHDPTSDWTTNRDWFGYNYSLASRIHLGAFSIANDSTLSFDLPLPQKYQNKPIEMWMRVFSWPKGRIVNVDINGNKSSSYSLFSERPVFPLIKIFDGKSTNQPYHFKITNLGGSNYIEGIYIKEKSIGNNNNINKLVMFGTQNNTNLVSNPDFIPDISVSTADNTINTAGKSRLPTYWSDPLSNCNSLFKCTVINSKEITAEGQKNNNGTNSLQVSTNTTNKNRWSYIVGTQIDVKPWELYAYITHMKLNEFATASHIPIEGYNETSKKWHQIIQCPIGTNGPLEWKEFGCEVTIPKDTVKIRPVLNAGWSSQPGKQAVTLFGLMNISRLDDASNYQNIPIDLTLKKITSDPHLPSMTRYTRLNPTLWHVNVNNAEKPFVLSFSEPYDSLWEAIVYKDGKKVDVSKSGPLYAGINGFHINQIGNLDITIRYGPQDLFEIGLVISGLTLFFCLLFYLLLHYRKDKPEKWRQKISSIKRLLNR